MGLSNSRDALGGGGDGGGVSGAYALYRSCPSPLSPPSPPPPPIAVPPPAARRPPAPDAHIVPVVVSWNFGGASVCVTGAWDAWRTRTALARHGPGPFVAVLYLPVGRTFHFKFLVDGDEWHVSPALPTARDARGNTNNVVVVAAPDLVFSGEGDGDGYGGEGSGGEDDEGGYDNRVVGSEAGHEEPPVLPAAAASVAGEMRPCNALIGHTRFDEGGGRAGDGGAGAVSMASTFRWKEKVVTAIYVSDALAGVV